MVVPISKLILRLTDDCSSFRTFCDLPYGRAPCQLTTLYTYGGRLGDAVVQEVQGLQPSAAISCRITLL